MVTSEPVYDPVRAKQAAQRLVELIQSVDNRLLENYRPNIDIGMIAIVVLAVAEYASKPEVRKAFELIAPEHFAIRHLNMLTDLGWAAWYAKVRYNDLVSTKTTATVPSDLVQRITDRKQRMLRVADYHLQDNPTASLSVQAIRKGTGYFDDASDLTSLAGLYQTYKDEFAGDKRWYREDDAREAEQDAAALVRLLGAGDEGDAKQALDFLNRIFIRLLESYDEVRAAACFIFRHQPEHLAHFPILYTAVRRAPRSAADEPAQPQLVQPSAPAQTPAEASQPVQNRSGSRGPFVE